MKHYLRFMLVLLLSTIWSVGGYSQTWVKVTDVSNLNEGDEVTFVNEKYQAALGSKKKNNFSKVNVTISNNSFENVSNLTALKLVKQGENWLFMLDNMYLYAASSSDNYLKTTDEKTNDNTRATITISKGDAAIKFQGKNLKNIIKYNNGSSIFSCYGVTNNQQPIQLYKKASTGTPTTIAFNAGFDATKTYTFTDGVAPSDYTQPTVTLSTSEATGKGAIVYTSSEPNVVDVDKTTGVLSFAGKTVYNTEATISAQFVATAGSGYANSNELTYKVKNVEAAKPTLSFSEERVTVMQGKETEFTAPTLTLLDAEGNPVTLAENDIFYESLDEGVAKIENQAICKIDFITPGTADIKASYIGSNTAYENLSATFTLIYKEKVKTATTVEFTSTVNSVNINDNIFVKAVVKANDVEVEGVKVIYSASNENVIVDENTGEVVGNKEGTSTITASFAGNVDYAASSNTFDVIVTDPNKKTVTFDFSKPEDYGYVAPTTSSKKTELKNGDIISKDGVILTNVNGGKYSTRFTNASDEITFRIYSGVKLTLLAPDGYVINNILFDDTYKTSYINCTPGVLDSSSQTWSGLSNLITITIPEVNFYAFFKTMTVTCIKKQEITLNEKNNDKVIGDAAEIKDNLFDVTLNRSMPADGGWYTFCVPFDIEDIATTPLKDAQVRKYSSMSGSVMNFEETTSLKAAHAYLVKPTANIENPVFENVTVSRGDKEKDGANGYFFEGIYSEKVLLTDGTNLFLGAENKFYVPTETDKTLKALRGYFVVPEGTSASKMGINIDGETTSISALNTADAINGKVYNLNGQYVGNDVKSLKKGVYVVNGRKFIVK